MSLAKRLMEKESRRNLQRRCDHETQLRSHLTRSLAAILIANEGRVVVEKSNLLLANNMRVNATADDKGNQVLTLQDEDGQDVVRES